MKVLVRLSALGDVVLVGSVTGALAGGAVVVSERRWLPVVERLRGVRAVAPWPEVPSGDVVDLQANLATWRRLGPGVARIHKRSLRRRLGLYGIGDGRRPSVPELYGEAAGVTPVAGPWLALSGRPTHLVLAPGASKGAKRWDPQRFGLLGRSQPDPVVVIGSRAEEGLVRFVAGLIPGAELAVEDGFERTFEVLGAAKALVSGDTAWMHLAGAAGVPAVALFGPTDPRDGFAVHRGRVLALDVPCRPCSLHGVERCPLVHHRCMDHEVGAVAEALAGLSRMPTIPAAGLPGAARTG